jgi:hypothetical protein
MKMKMKRKNENENNDRYHLWKMDTQPDGSICFEIVVDQPPNLEIFHKG